MENVLSPSSHLQPSRKRNKKGSACTHCRQLKFKCDAEEQFPDPCSRCAKSGHRCTVDSSFKRVANKQRLDSLEKELRQMRQELQLRGTEPLDKSYPATSNLSSKEIPETPSIADGSDTASTLLPILTSETINGIEISADIILALIQEYYTHHHPRFPILFDQAIFLQKYNVNKLLLWTILAIASGESTEHSHFYPLLVDPVRQLASDLYSSLSRSFETVQALLLLCAWPFPYQRTINDPSPMYGALATQIAYQLGLHRPQFAADFAESMTPYGNPGEFAGRKLWFGCVIINFCFAAKLGVPSAIRPGYTGLLEMTNGSTSLIPEPLLSGLCLAHIGGKALTALGDYEYSASGALPDCLPMILTFESELVELRERLKHRWSSETEIFYRAQLVQIYSFALFGHADKSHISLVDSSTNQIHAKAVSSILQLSSIASSSSQDSQFWPAFIKYSILYGVIFNVPLANMEKHGSFQRLQLLQSLRSGVLLLKSFSKFEKDIWSRISSHVSYFLRKLEEAEKGEDSPSVTIAGLSTAKDRENEHQEQSKVPVRSRMAANIMYHVVWTGKHASQREEKPHPQENVTDISGTANISHAESSVPNPSESFLGMEGFDPLLNEYAYIDDWTNTGMLDISADWQSLIQGI